MKKFQTLLKDKDIAKDPDFKRVIRVYKACLKHYIKATELRKKAKGDLALAKKKKSATKEKLHDLKGKNEMAKNYRAMWWKLLKASADHVERWVKIHEDYKTIKDESLPTDKQPDDKKKKSKKKNKKSKTDKPKAKKTTELPKLVVAEANKAEPEKSLKPASKSKKTEKTTDAKAAPAAKPPVNKAVPKQPAQKKAAPKPHAQKKAAVPKAIAALPGTKDNLKKIEGIGPKIEGLLNADGLYSFAHVGKASVAKLQGILDKAGPRYLLARPATWPQQAKLAAAGKWEELSKLQAELKAGQKK